jgi:hypothetical protein
MMSEFKGTPGPWQLTMPDFDKAADDFDENESEDGWLRESHCASLSGPGGKWQRFAHVFVAVQGVRDDEGVANANLLAASWDMFQALQLALARIESDIESTRRKTDEGNAIRAALAKALGASPAGAGGTEEG